MNPQGLRNRCPKGLPTREPAGGSSTLGPTDAQRICPPENQQGDRAHRVQADLQGNPPQANTHRRIERVQAELQGNPPEANTHQSPRTTTARRKRGFGSTFGSWLHQPSITIEMHQHHHHHSVGSTRDICWLENISDDPMVWMAMQLMLFQCWTDGQNGHARLCLEPRQGEETAFSNLNLFTIVHFSLLLHKFIV